MTSKILFLLYVSFVSEFVCGTFITRDELYKYTKVSTTTDGEPCLGGCSPITKECVVNWRWTKKPCNDENRSAPIFFTSQVRDKNNTQCWSNCGRFGHIYEWCVTSANNEWDYCSSQVRGTETSAGRSLVNTYTTTNKLCESSCEYDSKFGYTCYYKLKLWAYCAKQAITRVPTLPSDFNVGTSKKKNCEAFMSNLIKERVNVSSFNTDSAPDNYISELANDIEAATKAVSDSGAFILQNVESDPVRRYTMANVVLSNGSSVLVPAVIRAKITSKTIRKFENLIDVRSSFADDDEGYFSWRIIGYEIGGSGESYNFALQAPRFTENWSFVERAIKQWTSDTEGSVDMIVIVLYKDEQSVVPKAFGVELSFNNPDGTAFVSCKDTIYWNNINE